jgi:hypothetical protein
MAERGILTSVFAGKANRQAMQSTLFTDYALRLLMYLGVSDDERPIPIQEISDGCDVSHHYTLADIITRKERLTPLLGLAR